MLQIFIGLKNPLPWPGWNPQTLGPMASIYCFHTVNIKLLCSYSLMVDIYIYWRDVKIINRIDLHHANGVRLCLWTADTNWHVVYPPHDTRAWKTMVEWKTVENSWLIYQSSVAILLAGCLGGVNG
jgi:hypothetical protein